MSDFTALKEQREELGLSGEDLVQYVLGQQKALREERAREREAQKETELARLNTLKVEAELQKSKQDHELQMARLSSPSITEHTTNPKVQRPTMPLYQLAMERMLVPHHQTSTMYQINVCILTAMGLIYCR